MDNINRLLLRCTSSTEQSHIMQKQFNTLQERNHTMVVIGLQQMTTAWVDTVWTREHESNNMEPMLMSQDNGKIRQGLMQAITAYRATNNTITQGGQHNHMDTGKIRLDRKSIGLQYSHRPLLKWTQGAEQSHFLQKQFITLQELIHNTAVICNITTA